MTFLTGGFIWYQVIAHFGISIGLHRYFAHRQFKAPIVFEWAVLYMCVIAGARSPIGWIGAHRMHHHDSDGSLDPHSPRNIGFWNVLLSRWYIPAIPPRFVKDLFQNSTLRFFHHYWLWIWVSSAAISLFIGWKFFVGFMIVPGALSYVGFGLINSVCHRNGVENNTPWINLLVAGEGYHKRHHESGGRIRLASWDSSGIIIEALLRIGVIKR